MHELDKMGLEAAITAATELTIDGGAPVPDYVSGILSAYLSTTSAGVTEEQTPRALDEARALVAEANNSLFGSQAYFHSLNGGPFDKHHLSRAIEELKERARRAAFTPVANEQPFAWTSCAGMKAIAEGREAFMFPACGDTAHLIPLYTTVAEVVAALRKPGMMVFLDGRNEHGSHVIPSLPMNMEIDGCEGDIPEFAEEIIHAAEALGFVVGEHVWTEWLWHQPQIGDEGRVELDGYWEFVRVNPVVSRALALEASRVDAPVSQKEPVPVGEQWRALEDGSPKTSWYYEKQGDRAGWEALAKRNPATYQIETRALYASAAPAGEPVGIKADDRLYNADEPMADGEVEMTAAENVLGWLIIEKIGVPDDRNYSPNEAQAILSHRLDAAREMETALVTLAFSDHEATHPSPTPVSAPVVTPEMVEAAIDAYWHVVHHGEGYGDACYEAAIEAAFEVAFARSPAVVEGK